MERKSFFYANYFKLIVDKSCHTWYACRFWTKLVTQFDRNRGIQVCTHCFSLDFGSECLQRRKKSWSVFVHHSKPKQDDKIVLQRVGFKISRERQGLLLQSRKMAKRWQSSWKTIETTAESSLTSFLASGTSFFGREAVRRATKKIGRRTVLKVYCSGREASRKTPGSGLLSVFPGKCRTFRKCIE